MIDRINPIFLSFNDNSMHAISNNLCSKIWFVICFFCSTALAAEDKLINHHHNAFGTHGMAIFSTDDQLLASHMPLANSMHAYQIIFSFNINDKNTQQMGKLFQENALMTLMPKPFDLFDLMSGKLTTFKGDIYAGHFERGGQVIFKDITISIEKLHLSVPLTSNENGHYYVVPLQKNSALLVHRIGQLPSFDQIIQISFLSKKPSQNTLTSIGNDSPLTVETAEQYTEKQTHFSLGKFLYLEQQDFEK